MAMTPGQLNKIITLQQRSVSPEPGESGGEVFIWAKVATVWASVSPVKGRELITSMANHSEITTVFRIRYLSGIDATMRIVYDGKYYDIKAPPIDRYERHEELEILTGTGLNDG